MIKKKENCEYCGEKMESKTAKKRFCSDKCRVYFSRESKNAPVIAETAKISIKIEKPINTIKTLKTQKNELVIEKIEKKSSYDPFSNPRFKNKL
jgi:hypothetical protein